ncbi:hypothetical protein U91I_03733 [alpha proteobacterium U9-1i]|nr:hypothetical protein U91I_03733 [alpha proteobacterium U9-1i]
MMRSSGMRIAVALALGIGAWTWADHARAQTATEPVPSLLQRLSATESVTDILRGARVRLTRPGGSLVQCNPFASFRLEREALQLTCARGDPHTYSYAEPVRRLGRRSAAIGRHVLVDQLDEPRITALTSAWATLAISSTNDETSAFEAAVSRARASGVDQSETRRRTQVRVEALLSGERHFDAALAYAETLEASPDWALGHYNLSLVLAHLEMWPEAISEMRRYLIVEPNAPDARAAQDQIYRWETLAEGQ